MGVKTILAMMMAVLPGLALADEPSAGAQSGLDEFVKEQAGKLPEVIDGVKIYRPALSEGKLTVSDLLEFDSLAAESIFVNALLYAVDNIDKETERIEAVDFDARRFVLGKRFAGGSGKDATEFTCKSVFQAADGILSFASYDIVATYKEKGILPRTRELEKLEPEKKSQHKDVVEAFSFMNSKYVQELSRFVAAHSGQPVSHWDEIRNGEVVKGMNETEVKLAVGRPLNIRKTSGKVKWMMSNSFVIIFTDGVVTTVVR